MLIAIAYTAATLNGIKIKHLGVQKYIGRLNEVGRIPRRHSSFWVGLYGQLWIMGMEYCSELIANLMQLRRNKLPNFKRRMRAAALIQASI